MLYEEDYTVNEVRDQKRRATERKNREAAKGAMDLPFLLLTLLLTGIGLLVLEWINKRTA